MKRIAAVLGTTLTVLLVAAGAAQADTTRPPPVAGGCGGGYMGPTLGTQLHYRSVHWYTGDDPDDGSLGIDAPRSWSFVRTALGEGRFHDKDGHDLLSLRLVTAPGTPAAQLSNAIGDLAGTSGFKVVGQHVKNVPSLGEQWATLVYRYTTMGEPRTVKVRWIAYGTASDGDAVVVLTVAGRPLDGAGLDALLKHATPTVHLAG